MLTTETLMVAINLYTKNEGTPVLVVGKKEGAGVKIINAIQGEEAVELYNKLITKKEK